MPRPPMGRHREAQDRTRELEAGLEAATGVLSGHQGVRGAGVDQGRPLRGHESAVGRPMPAL
eukprot:4289723-Alexandrium_andersonii.AAC.1